MGKEGSSGDLLVIPSLLTCTSQVTWSQAVSELLQWLRASILILDTSFFISLFHQGSDSQTEPRWILLQSQLQSPPLLMLVDRLQIGEFFSSESINRSSSSPLKILRRFLRHL